MSAMEASDIKNRRELLYSIVTSRCPTSMTKYKLYDKAQQVYRRSRTHTQKATRKSRRQQRPCSTSSSISSAKNIESFTSQIFMVPAPKTSCKLNEGFSRTQIFEDEGETKVDVEGKVEVKVKGRKVKRRRKFMRYAKHANNQKRPALATLRKTPPKRFDSKSTPPKVGVLHDKFFYHVTTSTRHRHHATISQATFDIAHKVLLEPGPTYDDLRTCNEQSRDDAIPAAAINHALHRMSEDARSDTCKKIDEYQTKYYQNPDVSMPIINRLFARESVLARIASITSTADVPTPSPDCAQTSTTHLPTMCAMRHQPSPEDAGRVRNKIVTLCPDQHY